MLSGNGGTQIVKLRGRFANNQLGYSVSAAGDMNRDSKPDLIAGAPFVGTPAAAAGPARVLSVVRLPLVTDTHEVSVDP